MAIYRFRGIKYSTKYLLYFTCTRKVKHSYMRETINKILKTISTLLVAVMVILALLLVGPRAVGMQVFVVLSGSMEPTYQTGSVIYVKDVDPMTLTEGDPVTFRAAEDTIVTHRIIEVIPDDTDPNNQYFRTKGDANEVEDGGVTACEYVVGKPVFTVPHLGYLAAYIQEPPGTYIAISAAAAMMLIVLLIDTFTEDKEAEAQKQAAKKAKNKRRKKADEDTSADELNMVTDSPIDESAEKNTL